MVIKMARGDMSGSLGTGCNLPGDQCYANDPDLNKVGLVNNRCAVPNEDLRKAFNSFSNYGGRINQICVCSHEFCNTKTRFKRMTPTNDRGILPFLSGNGIASSSLMATMN